MVVYSLYVVKTVGILNINTFDGRKREVIEMGSRRTEGGSIHLKFEKLPLEGKQKLHKYNVINDQFNEIIGIIHWRGGWHQYVYQADAGIDMSRSCHKEIDTFIDKIMKEWRDKRKVRK